MSEGYRLDYVLLLQSFSNEVEWIDSLTGNGIEEIFDNACCILVHDSIDNKEEKERVIALAKLKSIPFCNFSNGFTATIFQGDSIIEIKKDRLYINLLGFITHFRNTGKIDLKLLSLGLNYEVEKASIIQDRLINITLLNNKNNFNYEVAFPSGSAEYRDLMELFYLSSPETDFSAFEDMHNSHETDAIKMRELILGMAKKIRAKYEL